MTAMLEKAGRALARMSAMTEWRIYRSGEPPEDWLRNCEDLHWDGYADDVLVVLSVLREPTEDMLTAALGEKDISGTDQHDNWRRFTEQWQAAVNEARRV